MGKVALIFWWATAAANPPPAADIGIQSNFGGLIMEQVRWFDTVAACNTAQAARDAAHKDDVIVMSACVTAGSGFILRGEAK